jgi:hypothetical protein
LAKICRLKSIVKTWLKLKMNPVMIKHVYKNESDLWLFESAMKEQYENAEYLNPRWWQWGIEIGETEEFLLLLSCSPSPERNLFDTW